MLLDHVGWRAIFAVCVLFGIVAFSLLAAYLPETSRERHPDLGLRQSAHAFKSLLRDPGYLGPAVFFACIMATFFVGDGPYVCRQTARGAGARVSGHLQPS